ncbi:sulfate ABC transporter permease [Planctomicrobium sp. SH668]|uniref:sulfate ABC transporter permease n=1 Tax=Planctomicrobium sp. SH668 TaxID=3448126 RepID=UPI003F5B41A8
MQVSHSHGLKKANATAQEPFWLRCVLITLAFVVVFSLILVPVLYVFYQALLPGAKGFLDTILHVRSFSQLAESLGLLWSGFAAFFSNLFGDPNTRHAIFLTFTVAPIAVILNTVFGVAAAWTITKFRFPGRSALMAFLDVPFAISPVVAGLMFVLLFGSRGLLGPTLNSMGLQIINSWPGIVLATSFVTMPFIARELIPLMQSLGSDEEMAAVSLGASPWQLFWRVTFPNIRWGLLFGIIQCNARAIGEYGAVFVVSGRIEGKTDTMPLRVEKLFFESNNPGSYAVASALTLMALATLIGKIILENILASQEAARRAEAEELETV